jgi:DNA-binding NtrC family response regulator
MKVLVVVDDPNLRSLWGREFEQAGLDVLRVENEIRAIGELQANPYDLVVIDLCPNREIALGVTTFATYRNPSCKVVVVCGSSGFSRGQLFAMSPAVAAALRKPVDIEDLMEVCERVVRNERVVPVPGRGKATVEFRT